MDMILHTLHLLLTVVPFQPVTSVTPSNPRSLDGIEWFAGAHMNALGKARREDRMVALYFWMDGSGQCARMFNETLQDANVVAALEAPVCLGIDIAGRNGAQMVKRYGITTLPTLLLLSPEGEREEAVLGFIDSPTLLGELQRIRSGSGTVSDFRRQVAADPDNLQLLHDLALKLRDVGDLPAHDAIVADLRRRDPKGKTLVGARLLFWEVRAKALATGAPAEVDLQPVYAQIGKLLPQQIRFEAWEWLAGFEYGRGQLEAARDAYRQGWDVAGVQDRPRFGVQTTLTFWKMRADLDRREIAFMVEISKAALEAARAFDQEGGAPMPDLGLEEEGPENVLAVAIDAHSMAKFLSGQKARAIQLIQEAIQLNPNNDDFTRRLALYKR